MKKEEAIVAALALANRSSIAMLGTNDKNGFPNIKAMIKVENEGLNRIWFSTNTASRRVDQLIRDSKACVYLVDFDRWMGLMLVGEVEILQDMESRTRLWHEGDEKYYPKGLSDPDYTVLRFTASRGNYYHGLCKVEFELKVG